ncbi:GreA/GreB family elongation factor [Patescibacteria group bacterium]|nr:GreA/GreB family elongation factor [Patescibacteria group bacterium]
MEERNNFYLTKEGLNKLKKEYETLKVLRSNKIKGDVPSIWESEDLNPDYLAFQEDLNFLETRLAELEVIIEKAVIIKKPPKKDTVVLGATIAVQVGDQKDEFTIVGTLEANPMLRRISDESPVGSALLGHKVGDEVTVSSPMKAVYRIKNIKYN